MRKYGYLILLLFLCGCQKQELAIETIVENKNNTLIAITYPTTGISKLDKEIQKYVDKSYEAFQTEYESFYTLAQESEFNMDYQYWEIDDHYINVILNTFINSSNLAHPINEIKTFVYDCAKNKIISAQEFLGNEKFNTILPIIKQSLIAKYKDCIILESLESEISGNFVDAQFTIDENNITFHFDPYKVTSGNCGIVKIDIPLEKIGIHFNQKTIHKLDDVLWQNNKIIDPKRPVVAITFDDGPSKYTREIIDLLQQYDANGTFFVLGNKVLSYQDTIRYSLERGNEIGNHSYNHKWLTRLDVSDFQEQIQKTQSLIQDITGYTPTLLRPTYGSVNKKIRNNTDLKIVLWNVDSLDWKIKDSKRIAERVLKKVEDMDIILFHDTYNSTLKALQIILPELEERGYQFVTISELDQVRLLRNKTQ